MKRAGEGPFVSGSRRASFWFDALILAAAVVYLAVGLVVLVSAPLWIGRLW